MAISRCHEIAERSIHDIAMTSQMNLVLGCNAVWFIFQAVLVPLLGLYVKDPTVDDSRGSREPCRGQVKTVKLILYRMQTFGITARRSLDVISRIAESAEQDLDLVSSGESHGEYNDTVGDSFERIEECGMENQLKTRADAFSKSQVLTFEEPSIGSFWDYIGVNHDDI